MWYVMTEVTVVLTPCLMYNSLLDAHVERIQLPKYTTMRDLERETLMVVQFWYAVSCTG